MSTTRSLTTLSTSLRRALNHSNPLAPHLYKQAFTASHHRSQATTTHTRLPHARTHFETRKVPFTPSQLYSVVSNVNDYQNFVPWCTSSLVTSQIDEKHLIADLSVGFRLLSDNYTSVITLDPNKAVSADVPNSNLFEYLITDWRFREIETGCELEFYVEFAFRNPLYQRVTNLFFEEVVRQMVTAFEKRCHHKYQTPNTTGIWHRW